MYSSFFSSLFVFLCTTIMDFATPSKTQTDFEE